MDNTKNMLRAIINGQSAMKQELLGEIRKVDDKVEKLDKKVDTLGQELKRVESNLTKRIDKIGLQVSRLEDDAPPREEFDDLDSRVNKLEQITASI
jgi:archaellum component FlaC